MTRISRRTALTAGAMAAGGIAGGIVPREAHALTRTWGDDFLAPFSPPKDVKRDIKPGKTPIRLSCSANHIDFKEGADIGETVKRVRDAGYTAAEGTDDWKRATDSQIRELKDALRQHDVMFYTIHRCINNIHPDPAERRRINLITVENIEAAERLGIDFIVSHTGSCTESPTQPHRDNWTEETWKLSVQVMKQIIKDTEGSRVSLAIEALNPCNINTPRSHVKLKEDVGSDRIKVTLDPQNMINMTTCYRTTELVNDCFSVIPEEDICYMHCKDARLTENMLPAFEWVVPGTGLMDFENCLAHLSRLKRPRAYFLEFLSADKYPDAKRYIEETAGRIGVTIYS